MPDVANVIRFRALFTIQGKQDQGLRFFEKYTGGAPAVSDLLYFLGLVKAEADSVLPTLMTPEVTITGWIAEDLSSATGAVAELTDDTVGTNGGGVVPAGVATVVSYEIARRYRGGHPRSYWPLGYATALTDEATWNNTFVSNAQTAIDDVMDSLPASTSGSTVIANQVNVSYYDGFTSVENPITHRYRNVPTLRATPVLDNVTSLIVRPYVGSQRRRRPKTS